VAKHLKGPFEDTWANPNSPDFLQWTANQWDQFVFKDVMILFYFILWWMGPL